MEFSTVTYSTLMEHPEFRIDAECYKPIHLQIEKSITKKKFSYIKEFADSVINFGAYSLCNHIEFIEAGKPFLVTEDINNNIIDTENLHYISEEVHWLLQKSHCYKGQVLLTMAGAYLGQAAVFNEDFECSSNQAIAKITLKENSVNPYYLSTFLNCRHGQSQIERFKTGTGQPNLNLGLIKMIKVVDASEDFQTQVALMVNDAFQLRKTSLSYQKKANRLLLSELGLLDWKPNHQLSFVRNFSDTEDVERIDAEYFQPKYDEIMAAIQNYSGGWERLGNLLTVKKCVEVGSDEYLDEGIPFVRVSNISPFEITEEKYICEALYHELEVHQPKQGEILFTKDATPGIAYYFREEPKEMILSGGVLRLTRRDTRLNAETLTLILNGLTTEEQMKRDVGGSVILHWRPEQIKNVLIPLLDSTIQTKIQTLISESFELRKRAKNLLEMAKRTVEIAIEEGEEAGLSYMKQNALK